MGERPNTIHEIPDELHAIPSMTQEKVYKVCFGDKKECVRKIFGERKLVEKWMAQKRFASALEGYQDLCESLEKHVRRPHDYYLQCRSGIAHCIWNLYCTQFPEQPIDEFDESSRDLAKEIYMKSNLVEEIPPEYEYTGPSTADSEVNSGELTAEDKEKAALLEATKKMLDESSQRVAEARDGTEALKKESEDTKQAFVAQQTAARETQAQAETVEEPPKPAVKSTAEIALENEGAKEKVAKEKKMEEAEKEQEEKRSRKKQWEAEDNERKQRENERRKKREKATEKNLKREKEREKKAREMKKKDEEEKRLERERQWELKQQRQREDHERQAKEKERKKRDEEYELAMLLSEIGNSFEPCDSVLIQLEAEQGKPPFKTERVLETGSDEPIRRRDTPGSVELNGNKETKKRAEEEKKKRAIEEKREEEEKKNRAEEERKKKIEQEEKKRAEDEQKKRAEEEVKKRDAEEQEKRRLEDEARAAQEKKKVEEEERKKKAEEEKKNREQKMRKRKKRRKRKGKKRRKRKEQKRRKREGKKKRRGKEQKRKKRREQ